MKNKRVSGPVVFLTLLLVLSVSLNALLLLTDQIPPHWADTPIGTYCTTDASSPSAADGMYLVLEPAKTYCLYRQGERLATGQYVETSQPSCYMLHSSDDAISNTQLIWTGESVYWLTPDSILPFYKFSDTPVYINLP